MPRTTTPAHTCIHTPFCCSAGLATRINRCDSAHPFDLADLAYFHNSYIIWIFSIEIEQEATNSADLGASAKVRQKANVLIEQRVQLVHNKDFGHSPFCPFPLSSALRRSLLGLSWIRFCTFILYTTCQLKIFPPLNTKLPSTWLWTLPRRPTLESIRQTFPMAVQELGPL